MNERIPQSPPVIKPLPENIERPLWSVMIPVYNCSQFLKHSLESVLQQDPGASRMQIQVVDDCSTDADVKSLVEKIGKGRVEYFRQKQNKGSLRNFETCINLAKGHYVHLLHGDDFVNDGFYQEMESLLTDYPEAGAACCAFWHVNNNGDFLYPNEKIGDERGILKNWLDTIAEGQKLQPPAVVVKREVYERLGSFFNVHYGEDWEMWVRVAAHYPFAFSPLKLACYRVHSNQNITSLYFQSGQHIKDISKTINTIQAYLPSDKRKYLKKSAKKKWSIYYARTSDMVYHKYNKPDQAIRQAKMAFYMSKNSTTILFLLKMYVKKVIRYKR
jgi:glycosyltransferase involved in cell wall biosynthesis